MPESKNSLVLLAPDFTVTLEPPAVIVPVMLLVVPTVTVPKLRVLGEAESEPVAPPVPLSLIDALFTLEVTVMLPVTLPVAVGLNWVVNVTLWPPLKVIGKVKPDMLNPVPEMDELFSWMLVVPVFLMLAIWVVLLPTVTVP